ncbi:hypothetical protein [Streptomyces sp. SID8352]|uniref:DUF6907 domain-containing protein n=1 Tax=Streptomyces sp. SID8352 TaxID=2690338 RepID=UPI00136D4969|nr:hypothetical protein [Streptomyces sp. SID8352]MYU22712.1 hypothetical protein [Streptomyces sp. SID8352]
MTTPQDPQYRHGTVTLRTIDHGQVTVPEPAWCTGHDNDPVNALADLTHNGAATTASAVTARYGQVDIMDARITQTPHGRTLPEPRPLLVVHVDVDATVAPEDARHLAQALRVAAVRLDRLIADLAHLRGEHR